MQHRDEQGDGGWINERGRMTKITRIHILSRGRLGIRLNGCASVGDVLTLRLDGPILKDVVEVMESRPILWTRRPTLQHDLVEIIWTLLLWSMRIRHSITAFYLLNCLTVCESLKRKIKNTKLSNQRYRLN